MILAQLAKRLLPTPEIHGSNPPNNIQKFPMCLSVNCNNEKSKIKETMIELPQILICEDLFGYLLAKENQNLRYLWKDKSDVIASHQIIKCN